MQSPWFYLAAAALGIVALGLTIACPPAAGCAAIITASYVFGLADGAAGTIFASRDIYNSVEEDIDAYNAKQSLQDKIQELRDSRQGESIDPDRHIDPDRETKKILRYFNEQALSISTNIIRDKIRVVDGVCEDESIDPRLRENAKAGVDFCQSMLSASDDIRVLNAQILSLFKAELQTDDERPQHRDREEITTRFGDLIERLDIPKQQRREISKAIDENSQQLKEMKSDFTDYLCSSKDFRLEKAKSLQSKIALSKRSKLISGIGMTLAVVSLGLALACPFVGAPLVGVAVAVFATQLIVGAVATAIAANDFRHSQKEIAKNKQELREEEEGITNLSTLQQRLEILDSPSHDHADGSGLAPTTEIVSAGAKEVHRVEHLSSTPEARRIERPSASAPAKPTSDRGRP